MKFNWGTGIVLVFILFIAFILYFVISISTNDKYNYDLVSKDYYQQELNFQNDIDAIENGKKLDKNIEFERVKEGLKISFPKSMNPKEIKGKVFLYRPSNKKLDYEKSIQLSDSSYLLMPDKHLLDGRWNIIVNWTYNSQKYLIKKEIFY